ncbi:HAD-IC family P-type ATPase [Candidatus Uhrbacteria bacterium]|nr:HAD-IC family P-type ATPase [Candidatus Uhrbacteria bacterium]
MDRTVPENPHALTVEELAEALGSDVGFGLTNREAGERLGRFGANALPKAKPPSPFRAFFSQFHSGLTYILIAAVVVAVLLGDLTDAIVILVVIVINVVFGFVQERRADAAISKLSEMVVLEATVIREGETYRLPAERLVPGDVIVLNEGDRIPADARLLTGREFRVDESLLTGESSPVSKTTDVQPASVPLSERVGMVWMGTLAVAGTGRAIVTATGTGTAFGQVAASLADIRQDRAPFESAIDRLGWRLGVVSLAVVGLIAVIGLLRGEELREMFVFAVAMAVAVIPEGLPSVLTVVLAIGVWRMAKRRAVVRHVPSVETLGEADVICTDKTGTLTVNQMTVRGISLFRMDVEVSGEGYEPKGDFQAGGRTVAPAEIPELSMLLKAAVLGSSADIVRKNGTYSVQGDPTEGALAVMAAKAGFDRRTLEGKWQLLDEMPFSSERKMRASLLEGTDPDGRRRHFVFAVGAFEVLGGMSSTCLSDEEIPYGQLADRRFVQANERMGLAAERVLAVAMREVPVSVSEVNEALLRDMTFLGLVGMVDPPRLEAAEAIRLCRRAGIRVIMITGDQKPTALAVAREVGLIGPEEDGRAVVFSESEVAEMADEVFEDILGRAAVFARITPATKLRLVGALKRRGHIVAMTGDGVNDALALKKANIGIAMGRSGTDVAREVSDIILLDDNFATIVRAVEEGRVVFRNVKQTTAYLFTTNIAEAMTILLALVAGVPIPILAGQILWMNLVTDGFPDMALATEPAGDGVLDRPPRRHGSAFITPNVMFFALVTGLLMSSVTIGLFAWSLGNGGDLVRARTIAFTTMCFLQLWNVLNLRSETLSLLRIGICSNAYVLGAIVVSFFLQMAVLYLPFLNRMFKVVPLSLGELAVVVSVTFLVLPLVEGYKWLLRRRLLPESWL